MIIPTFNYHTTPKQIFEKILMLRNAHNLEENIQTYNEDS